MERSGPSGAEAAGFDAVGGRPAAGAQGMRKRFPTPAAKRADQRVGIAAGESVPAEQTLPRKEKALNRRKERARISEEPHAPQRA